jgi:hypothetical protein
MAALPVKLVAATAQKAVLVAAGQLAAICKFRNHSHESRSKGYVHF